MLTYHFLLLLVTSPYGTSTITYTYPYVNQSIPTNNITYVTIQYIERVDESEGYIYIYDNTTTPRFKCPSNSSDLVDFRNNPRIEIKIPKGVICEKNQTYHVKIDDGFVKSSSTNQPYVGSDWAFSTGNYYNLLRIILFFFTLI